MRLLPSFDFTGKNHITMDGEGFRSRSRQWWPLKEQSLFVLYVLMFFGTSFLLTAFGIYYTVPLNPVKAVHDVPTYSPPIIRSPQDLYTPCLRYMSRFYKTHQPRPCYKMRPQTPVKQCPDLRCPNVLIDLIWHHAASLNTSDHETGSGDSRLSDSLSDTGSGFEPFQEHLDDEDMTRVKLPKTCDLAWIRNSIPPSHKLVALFQHLCELSNFLSLNGIESSFKTFHNGTELKIMIYSPPGYLGRRSIN